MSDQASVSSADKPVLAGNMDTSLLKIIALVCMIFDHVGVAYFPDTMEFRIIGRMALPLYAWCLVVGSEYTHNAFKYALRLFVIGVISQPLNMMALDNPWSELNILFLLCLGVLAIAAIRKKWYFSEFWGPALCFFAVLIFNVDYGWKGLAFILLLYAVRKSKGGIAAAYLSFAAVWGMTSYMVTQIFGVPLTFLNGNLFSPILQIFFRLQSMVWLSLPLILIQTHSRLRMPHWLGYGLYPMHLAGLIAAGLIAGIPLATFIARLGMW